MIPWKEIDRAKIPGDDGDIVLLRRGKEFSIRTAGAELMNSRCHSSEEAMAESACRRIRKKPGVRILIGGLGMGYTLAAALKDSNSDARITAAELVPGVVRWNREYIGHLAKMPLNDPRISVKTQDVASVIKSRKSAWDAILLDVDNGPDALTRNSNESLYGRAGIKSCFAALCPGGILAVWSAAPNPAFTRCLEQCGFKTETVMVRARKPGKGARHTIWLASKP